MTKATTKRVVTGTEMTKTKTRSKHECQQEL